MPVKIRIPSPLQKLTRNQAEVAAEGDTVNKIFADLERQYPGIKDRLYGEDGKIRRFINIYINEEDIRFISGEETPVKDGDDISVIPAIAGGR